MLRGLPDLAKENYRKVVIFEDYQTFNIPYLFLSKGDNFHFFYKFDKFEIDFWACFK